MKLGILVGIALSVFSLNASAADGDYLKFLTALEGNWQGQGFARSYNGVGIDGSFDFTMSTYREGNTNTWLSQTDARASSGQDDRDGISFLLSGQNLVIDHDSITGGFAAVSESTDHSIDYVVSETQGLSFVDHYYHWEVSGNGLEGSVRVEVDGTPLHEESFSAQKSQSR
jgi:hypothetical protein